MNSAHSVSWLEVIKGVPNPGADCFICRAVFSYFRIVFTVYVVFCFIVFIVSTSAIDCLERLVSETTYYVLSGTLNPTHSPNYPNPNYCRCPGPLRTDAPNPNYRRVLGPQWIDAPKQQHTYGQNRH